ncbi:MAG: ATP-binding domain-containing protein, partial [Pontibacter sp.]|nr:ATP-binding domain-containing protein [Pontibacter sp.]
NYPKRGIGETTEQKLFVVANDTNHTVWEVVQHATEFLGNRVGTALENFSIMIRDFARMAEQYDAFEVAKHVAKQSRIVDELYQDKTVEGLARYENIQELLNGIKEYVDDPEKEDKSLAAFLQDIALITDADTKEDMEGEFVTMMTIHSAKGLEFKNVFIVGMEENLFPSQMMLNSRADLEEERRLFYVAITRAEKKLYLTYATSRYQWGNLRACEKSRFIDEIDPRFINFKYGDTHAGGGNVFDRVLQRKSSISSLVTPPARKQAATAYTPPADFKPSDTSTLAAGMKVEHPKFGFGVVTKMDTQGNSTKAIINFDEVGEKTLLLSFAKLRIHN